MKKIFIIITIFISFVFWILFFSRDYFSWSEKIVLSEGSLINIEVDYSNTKFWGHPHIISWGANDPYYEIVTKIDNETIKWKGRVRPLLLNTYKDDLFLVGSSQYFTNSISDLNYYKLNQNSNWERIGVEKFPKSIAYQNLFAHKFLNFSDFVAKIEMTCFVKDYSLDTYNRGNTYFIWKASYPDIDLYDPISIEQIKKNIYESNNHKEFCSKRAKKIFKDNLNRINNSKLNNLSSVKKVINLIKKFDDIDYFENWLINASKNNNCSVSGPALSLLVKERKIDKGLIWMKIKEWIEKDGTCYNYAFEVAKELDVDFLFSKISFFEKYLDEVETLKIFQKIGSKALPYAEKIRNIESRFCDYKSEKFLTLFRFNLISEDQFTGFILSDLLDENEYCKVEKLDLINQTFDQIDLSRVEKILASFIKKEFKIVEHFNSKLKAKNLLSRIQKNRNKV